MEYYNNAKIGDLFSLFSLRRTSWAGVSQFVGFASDGRTIYIRFKHGELSVWLASSRAAPALDGKRVYWSDYGDSHEFDITWPEISLLTGLHCTGKVEDKYA